MSIHQKLIRNSTWISVTTVQPFNPLMNSSDAVNTQLPPRDRSSSSSSTAAMNPLYWLQSPSAFSSQVSPTQRIRSANSCSTNLLSSQSVFDPLCWVGGFHRRRSDPQQVVPLQYDKLVGAEAIGSGSSHCINSISPRDWVSMSRIIWLSWSYQLFVWLRLSDVSRIDKKKIPFITPFKYGAYKAIWEVSMKRKMLSH